MELSTQPNNVLALFQTTKAERAQFVQQIVESLEEGKIDPLKVHIQVKSMEQMIDILTNTDEKKNKIGHEFAKRYKIFVLEAIAKYGSKSFELYNAKLEQKETGVKYDFTKCGSAQLIALYEELEATKEKIKAFETIIKTMPQEGKDMVNEDTGEVEKWYPPAKSSTTSIQVTLQ